MEWGPSAWKFLHKITFHYPDVPTSQQRISAEEMFLSLIHLLPCDECSEHYKTEISQNFPDTTSKQTLGNWLVNLHNKVNVRLGKPTMTYEHAKILYSNQCTSCNAKSLTSLSPPKNSKKLYLLFIILGIILIACLANYYKT